jgi:hypothetical protein
MGVTIAYRGRLADLARVEDFEDRLVDRALEMGAMVQVWRSWADDDPGGMVRGVIVNVAPGQEPTSLRVSPEGWLIGLADVDDAEEGRLSEPPWCFVKTQFGPVEGHVAVVEMLAALKRESLADLEVSDDGGYGETRDLAGLVRNHSANQAAIDALAEGLRHSRLSREAAEDPDILTRHIERVAERVHRVFQGAGDLVGGLALAGGDRDRAAYGLRVVQLKRALRGAAFARGALFPLRAQLSMEHFDELFDTLHQMESDIITELGKVRCEHRGDDWSSSPHAAPEDE